MNFLLGSRGRLGRAIASAFPDDQVIALDRTVYANWFADSAVDSISRFFERQHHDHGAVYVAAGLIDPRAPADEHYRANFLLPRNVIEGATRAGLRVITFGTVMEQIIGDNTTNPYFSSKTLLGKFVSEFPQNCDRALHIRIHTLYGGGLPDNFMFLGQLFNALASRTPFNMSSGDQLREYHHIDDEVLAILTLANTNTSGVINLSHGDAITLRQLATHIFREFNSSELLNLGALPNPALDNYGSLFERAPALRDLKFRDTFPSVVGYLRSCKELLGATT